MATKFGIKEYSRVGNVVTFTVVALNSDGTIDTGYTGAFSFGVNNMTDPGPYTFTAGDQGQHVFTTTILDPNARGGMAANFPGGTGGANISVSGPSGSNVSFGNQGDHLLVGGAGNDIITGNIGNDTFRFEQGGNDTANGGDGDDSAYFGAAYTSADSANGGTGADRLLLQGDYSGGVTLGSLLAVESVVLLAGDDEIYDGHTGTDLSYQIVSGAGTVVSDNRLTIDASGLRSGETLVFDGTASAIDFTVSGGAGGDTLGTGSGNDYLDGGAGVDMASGGAGDDVYLVDDALDQVLEAAGEGNDRVVAAVSFALGVDTHVETLEAATGLAAIALTGNSLDQTIIGNDGANVLHGGGGAGDVLVGLGGDDVYYTDVASTQIVEAAGGGSDTLYTSVSYVLGGNAQVEILSTNSHAATSAISLTGNHFAQAIFGNAGNNVFNGGGGADQLIGLGGNDIYYVDLASVRVYENVGGGNDGIYSSVSYTLGAGQEIEFLSANSHAATSAINLTGNEFANTLYGNAGANVLDGKGGSDALIGLAGADIFAFTTAPGADNVDILFGFESGTDGIALDDAIFTQLGGPGALNANAFVTGTAATDADDRIIYDSATGQLFYDADGSGAGAQILFAILQNQAPVSAGDFMVI